MHRERFAPSPTGPLHLGHAFSALTAFEAAKASGGEFLLRIEDIDRPRCREEYVQGIFDDLHWLGISWPEPVLSQSERMEAYQAALDTLETRGLTYRCTCTRSDIWAALAARQEGSDPSGTYPGTCREKQITAEVPTAIRLNMRAALAALDGRELSFEEFGKGPAGETGHIGIAPENLLEEVGDIVLARRDIGTSYHIAVVVDDAHQGITHVTRGQDLFADTAIHVLLQKLLGLPTPIYRHHRLIRDEVGKRLAKRDDARAIARYRSDGMSPVEVKALIGL